MDLADVNSVAVLGAGTMGHGIAEVAALAGYTVSLRDIEDEFVQRGYEQIEWSLNKLSEKNQITAEEVDAALNRITPTVDLAEAVVDADVIIEAVPERMDIKREVYTELSTTAAAHTIFATNTSSLSISELAEMTDRPSRFCGMHFFNPPVRMPLVEVIAGEQTSDETLSLIESLAEAFQKEPVRVNKDSPGFIVNRILIPLFNEAGWMVSEDETSISVVDSTTKFDMGLPMGAFELADYVGIDVVVDVLEYMESVLGSAYTASPILRERIENEEFGKKSGSGFYSYDSGGVDIPPDAGDPTVERRLLAVMANEVAALVGDGVADGAAIDRAVTLGAGFPDGPVEMADAFGLPSLHEELADRYETTGAERYRPNAYLRERAELGRFRSSESDGASAFETIDIDRVDGKVAKVTINRPHRMNTITPQFFEELEQAIDELEADDAVRALLLVGAGDRAFSAGADVTAISSGGGSPTAALELSRTGQRAFQRLEDCSMPVVAGIDGYCLGGGMELAASADLRIATTRSELGQPEHNLGLLPGWGGTQRLPRLIGESRAKEIIFTAERFEAERMGDFGFVNEVVEHQDFMDRALELTRSLAAGPPIAQQLTKQAIHAGRDDIDAGLALEASAFGHLVGTDDLMEGVAAFMSDREPEFKGK